MSAITANPADDSARNPLRQKSILCSHWDRLAEAVRTIFPAKTAANMASLTGLQMRACEYFLSRKTSLSSDAVVAFLQSEEGLIALEALMGDARPEWWKALKRAIEIEKIKAEKAALQKRLDALEAP